MALSEKNQKPGVSSGFKIEVIKVSIALLLFVLVYISLFVVSLSAALLFTYFGIKLILFKPMFLTFIFGIGISIFGSLLFFFIIKFLFQKPEKAPVYEIPLSPEDYPELHAFVNQIAKDAGTSKPRKIVLYPNVNAGVYYNSAFLSMFFPVRKNLGIGMGLINSVNISEFKAILAHEFGHFSQRSMRFGIYVYNFNKIIYNLLFENETFSKVLEKIAETNKFIATFIYLLEELIKVIQWVLRQFFILLNKTNMSLSREMELNADAVAACLAGSGNVISGLRRLQLSDECYNFMIQYLDKLITENLKPENISPVFSEMLKDYSVSNNYEQINGLPVINNDEVTGRINIKNQWASHPSISDREKHLNRLNLNSSFVSNESPWILFSQPETVQKEITNLMYSNIKFSGTVTEFSFDEFLSRYYKEKVDNTFNPEYKGYYDNRLISIRNENLSPMTPNAGAESIFNKNILRLPVEHRTLLNDIETLKLLKEPGVKIKHFELDGKKISIKKTDEIISLLEKDAAEKEQLLIAVDSGIFHNSLSKATVDEAEELNKLYNRYAEMSGTEKQFSTHCQEFFKILSPIYTDKLMVDQAKHLIGKAKKVEVNIKQMMETHKQEYLTGTEIKQEDLQDIEKYLKNDQTYFYYARFDNEELDLMNKSIILFNNSLFSAVFKVKKAWLTKQYDLLNRLTS